MTTSAKGSRKKTTSAKSKSSGSRQAEKKRKIAAGELESAESSVLDDGGKDLADIMRKTPERMVVDHAVDLAAKTAAAAPTTAIVRSGPSADAERRALTANGVQADMRSRSKLHESLVKYLPSTAHEWVSAVSHGTHVDIVIRALAENTLYVPLNAAGITDPKVYADTVKDGLSPEQWLQHVRVHDADFVESLLVEAGVQKSSITDDDVDVPACCLRSECVGMRMGIAGFDAPWASTADPDAHCTGVVLMMYMTEEEYTHFMETGQRPTLRVPGGKEVPIERPCFLCYVYYLSMLVVNIEDERLTLPPLACLQRFATPCDRPKGFKSEFCHLPADNGWNGVASAVLKFRMDGLMAVRQRNGKYRISIDKMRYVEPDPDAPGAGSVFL